MKKYFLSLFLSIAAIGICSGQTKGTLLVVNKGDSTVSIIKLKSQKELARIKTGGGPHEVAVSPNGKWAAVTNYGTKKPGNSITVIDVIKREASKKIELGIYVRPHGIEFISDEELMVTCERDKALLRVNLITNAVSEIAVTDQLVGHMVTWSPSDSKAYVANITSGSVSVMDVKLNKLINIITLKKGIEGLSVSPDGKSLWVANRVDSNVSVVNIQSSQVQVVLPAHQIAFRVKHLANGSAVIVSNGGSGNLSIYESNPPRFLKDISLFNIQHGIGEIDKIRNAANPPVPVGIAVDRTSEFVFVACANYNLAVIIRTKDWSVVGTVATGPGPDGIYYSPIE